MSVKNTYLFIVSYWLDLVNCRDSIFLTHLIICALEHKAPLDRKEAGQQRCPASSLFYAYTESSQL